MSGVVEQMAALLGWPIARVNVIVEGTSDVAYLTRASDLHAERHGRPLIDADLAVLAAGKGNDGGVDGVSRRLGMFLQLADVDRDATGATRFRFAGLLDNDIAGRRVFTTADPIIGRYEDLFVLRPVMPAFPAGYDRKLVVTQANLAFATLDWEIEDLCSQRLIAMLSASFPGAVLSSTINGAYTHHELHDDAKPELKRIFLEHANFEDALGMIALLRILREYLLLPYNFIQSRP
ncbi:hypothetical protein [Ancylobacter sp. FA202]|uniref:hypothetical protein n=1 Tax=Ancylobacter sp. FA202 TaxID=1111106 RepID=UPI00036AC664|nr:hypothetical protein [Ancylobacter sp. FA202]